MKKYCRQYRIKIKGRRAAVRPGRMILWLFLAALALIAVPDCISDFRFTDGK